MEKGTSVTETLIVGAGIAGMSAAQALRERGGEFMIVEAGQEPGGRVREDKERGIALGAELIHGKHEAYALAEHFGLPIAPALGGGKILIASRDGRPEDRGEAFVGTLLTRFHAGASLLTNPLSRSVRDAIEHTRSAFDEDELALLSAVIEGEHLENPSAIALDDVLRSMEYYKDPCFRIRGGQQRLADALAHEVGREHIHCAEPVEHIAWDEHGVTCHTNRGVYASKKAILTLPVGVLRSQSEELFSPALPSATLRALRTLEGGKVLKAIVSFRKAFWEQADLSVLWLPYGTMQSCWPTEGKLPSLTAFIGGRHAEACAHLPEKQVIARALDDLRRSFGEVVTSSFADGSSVNWHENPSILSGYSVQRPNEEGRDARADLARPFGSIILAGEAMCVDDSDSVLDYTTVDAAILSGRRAARLAEKKHP